MSVMIVQTKCKSNNTELFLKPLHIQCKEIRNNKYNEEIKQQYMKNGKVRFRLNVDIRKEMEDSRLNTFEWFKTDYVRKRLQEYNSS